MAEKALKKVEDQLDCAICLDTYTDPRLLQCFHVYCQQCLVKLVFRDGQQQLVLTCPACRQVTPVPERGVAGLQPAFHINQLLEIVDTHKKEAAEEKFTLSIQSMEKQMAVASKVSVQLDTFCEEISNQKITVETDIHTSIGQLREILLETLEVRETELINQLDRITQRKLKCLAVQRDQTETTQAQLGSCLDIMKECLTTASHQEVQTTVAEKIKELTAPFQPDFLKPNTEADVMYFSSTQAVAMTCQKYGKLCENIPDSSKCQVTGIEVAVVGKSSLVTLQAMNCMGRPFEGLIEEECTLVAERTGTSVKCQVRRLGPSQYKVSYQPTTKGRHQLHIKVEGQHVAGSPFGVAVRSHKFDGTPLFAISGVSEPWGVVVNKKGEIVVSETGGCCISIFSPSGEKLRSFGSNGSGKGQFQSPCGVTLDGEGNILVADCESNCIQKFTSEGEFLDSVSADRKGWLDFQFPYGVAFNSSNNKFYVTDDSNCLRVLNSDLTYFKTLKSDAKFDCPRGIACDSTGRVYVADTGHSCVKVLSGSGKLLRSCKKSLDCASVAVDSNTGITFVSECDDDRISMFNRNGRFLSSFGTSGKGPAQFSSPIGLAVDASGVLYVCDSGNNRVVMF